MKIEFQKTTDSVPSVQAESVGASAEVNIFVSGSTVIIRSFSTQSHDSSTSTSIFSPTDSESSSSNGNLLRIGAWCLLIPLALTHFLNRKASLLIFSTILLVLASSSYAQQSSQVFYSVILLLFMMFQSNIA